jgi:hypothetical protein
VSVLSSFTLNERTLWLAEVDTPVYRYLHCILTQRDLRVYKYRTLASLAIYFRYGRLAGKFSAFQYFCVNVFRVDRLLIVWIKFWFIENTLKNDCLHRFSVVCSRSCWWLWIHSLWMSLFREMARLKPTKSLQVIKFVCYRNINYIYSCSCSSGQRITCYPRNDTWSGKSSVILLKLSSNYKFQS